LTGLADFGIAPGHAVSDPVGAVAVAFFRRLQQARQAGGYGPGMCAQGSGGGREARLAQMQSRLVAPCPAQAFCLVWRVCVAQSSAWRLSARTGPRRRALGCSSADQAALAGFAWLRDWPAGGIWRGSWSLGPIRYGRVCSCRLCAGGRIAIRRVIPDATEQIAR